MVCECVCVCVSVRVCECVCVCVCLVANLNSTRCVPSVNLHPRGR